MTHGERLGRFLILVLPAAALMETRLRLLFDAILVACAASLLFSRGSRIRLTVSQWWLLVYLAIAIVSTSLGMITGTVPVPSRPLPLLARTVELLLVPTLAFAFVRDKRQFAQILAIVGGAFLLYATLLISEGRILFDDGTPERRLCERAAGTLATFLPFLALLAATWSKKFGTALCAWILFLVFLSGSRASLAFTLVGTAAAFAVFPGYTTRIKTLVAASLLATLAVSFSERMLEGIRAILLEPPGPLEYGRFVAWKDALTRSVAAPWFGAGLGAQKRVLYDGDWVRLIHETGWLGLFAAAGFSASLLRDAWERRHSPVAAGLFGAVVVLLGRSLFGSPFLRASDGLLVYLLFAVFLSGSHNSSNTPPADFG